MLAIVQDRINLLQNSIKVLELILTKLRNQNKSFSLDNIQKRINSYKQELQTHKNVLT